MPYLLIIMHLRFSFCVVWFLHLYIYFQCYYLCLTLYTCTTDIGSINNNQQKTFVALSRFWLLSESTKGPFIIPQMNVISPPFKNFIKIFMKIFYLSFFTFLLLASIIVQLEKALNSLHSHTAKSIDYFV